MKMYFILRIYYTIPSDNRELQLIRTKRIFLPNYTIPSDNRELQLKVNSIGKREIIPYQVITGNYNDGQYIQTQGRLYHTK